MTGLETASAFAAIVGLLGQFTASTDAREKLTIDEYLDWLRRHEHRELADAIGTNTNLLVALRTLLSNQHSELVSKLEDIGKVINVVASRFNDFSPLADALGVEHRLSDQAIAILAAMNASNTSTMVPIATRGGSKFILTTPGSGSFNAADERFIDSDLNDLVTLGLLITDLNGRGETIYRITRAGASVGEACS